MPHSQPTALQQTVCKFHLDPQYHIFHWGSTILGDSTLCFILMCLKNSSRLINSLANMRSEWDFRWVIFKLILMIDGWSISCEIILRWMSLDLTDEKSTLVQVMAWCHQATSHYLSQCWPRSMPPCGITMPQWVNPVYLPISSRIASLPLNNYRITPMLVKSNWRIPLKMTGISP